jgi:hypothetical protein
MKKFDFISRIVHQENKDEIIEKFNTQKVVDFGYEFKDLDNGSTIPGAKIEFSIYFEDKSQTTIIFRVRDSRKCKIRDIILDVWANVKSQRSIKDIERRISVYKTRENLKRL